MFKRKEVDNNFIYETVSLVPANYSWMSCSSGHRYCMTAVSAQVTDRQPSYTC